MIVVDTSVWVATLRHQDIAPVRKLEAIEHRRDIVVGDLIMLEVLQGAQTDKHADRLETMLRNFAIVEMMGENIAVQAARHYRVLRGLGITIRKTVDLIIATFCIAEGYELLDDDRDFMPFEQHLGLRRH